MHYELILEEPRLFKLPFDPLRERKDLTLAEVAETCGLHLDCLRNKLIDDSRAADGEKVIYRFTQGPFGIKGRAYRVVEE